MLGTGLSKTLCIGFRTLILDLMLYEVTSSNYVDDEIDAAMGENHNDTIESYNSNDGAIMIGKEKGSELMMILLRMGLMILRSK